MSPPATVSVVRSAPTYVRPSSPTPLETLDLSAIDKRPGLRSKVRSLHVFENGRSAGAAAAAARPPAVIRAALSRALVHYYPIAGRLKEDGGDLQVACTGEGVLFFEASAGCKLEDVGYLDQLATDVACLAPDELLPAPAGSEGEVEYADLLLLVQVTEFECGGFVVGWQMCHSICDGLGAAQFLTAVGELARGAAAPTIKPVWQREAIPGPHPPTRPQPLAAAAAAPPLPRNILRDAVFDVPAWRVEELKRECSGLLGRRCSSFEVLVAIIWQFRARSILGGDGGAAAGGDNLELLIITSARHVMRPRPLPEGFYGNCIHAVRATSTASELARVPLPNVVELVRGALERLAGEFAEWAAGTGEKPPPPPYATLWVIDWRRLGLDGVDYGWGRAKHLVPLYYDEAIPVCLLCSPPRPAEGVRLITHCVEEQHLNSFRENVASILL